MSQPERSESNSVAEKNMRDMDVTVDVLPRELTHRTVEDGVVEEKLAMGGRTAAARLLAEVRQCSEPGLQTKGEHRHRDG